LIAPVYNAPLLLVQGEEKVLVAADLHLGLEHELFLSGISIPSQTGRILARLLGFIEEIRPDRLVLLGDVKHNVPRTSWQERTEVPEFLKSLSSAVRVDVVAGNHDSNLADMAPMGVRMRPASGFVLDGVGYFHGHTWPDEKTMFAKHLVAGHLHPAIRLSDPLGHGTACPVWARARIMRTAVEEHYGQAYDCDSNRGSNRDSNSNSNGHSNGEIIIAPAFNHLCGGLLLNEPVEDMRGPLMVVIDWDRARLHMLDGTDLGTLSEIKKAQRRRNTEHHRTQ